MCRNSNKLLVCLRFARSFFPLTETIPDANHRPITSIPISRERETLAIIVIPQQTIDRLSFATKSTSNRWTYAIHHKISCVTVSPRREWLVSKVPRRDVDWLSPDWSMAVAVPTVATRPDVGIRALLTDLPGM